MARETKLNPQVDVTLTLAVDIPDSDIETVEQDFKDEGFTVTRKKQKSGLWSLAAVK